MTTKKTKMDRYPQPGDKFYHLGIEHTPAKVMAVVDNWVMARRPGAVPFVIMAKEVRVIEDGSNH